MADSKHLGSEQTAAPIVAPPMELCDAALAALASRRDAVLERLDDAARGHGDRREVVHQLRVGSRRADAALEFFLPCLPHKKTLRLRDRLKKLRKAAGRVRDCDVLRELIRQTPRAHRRELKDRLKRRRKASERRLAKVVAGLRRKGSLARLWNSVLSHSPLPLPRGEGPGVRGLGRDPASIGEGSQFWTWAQEQFGLWLDEFVRQAPAALDSFEQLHAFRLDGKRLRYALELLPQAAQPEAAGLTAILKEIQERLGAICDAEALRQRLATWAAQSRQKSAVQFAADVRSAVEQEETLLAAARSQWPAILTQVDQSCPGWYKNGFSFTH